MVCALIKQMRNEKKSSGPRHESGFLPLSKKAENHVSQNDNAYNSGIIVF